ncbi:MAG TPA: [Fe-Fe] hydrogenase large subunit C-terminal domain-containing protein [Syntrophorhabdales bacterium]|nr:[Fe-Fe] hydrogenase large subunit C-terminal domain-containing protein [Syntrophorhabdales bacterium]
MLTEKSHLIPRRREHVPTIEISHKKCRRCFFCIQICPAKAIKLEKETLRVLPERCVFCGSCLKACPQQALYYYSGCDKVREFLADKRKTVAILDPSFPAVFEGASPRQLVTILKNVGFTEVWEGAFGADLVSRAYLKQLTLDGLLREHPEYEEVYKPLISTFCPVIVFYVQKYFTHLIPSLAPIVSPMIAAGRVARRIRPAWKVVYVTSCFAQMREVRSPEVAGAIDEVITIREVNELIEETRGSRRKMEECDFDGPRPYLGRVVPMVGGFYRSMGSTFDVMMDDVSVTGGPKRAVGALGQLATGHIKAKFLDVVYCEGCIDGPFVERELFLLGRRQIIARYAESELGKTNVPKIMIELDQFADIDLHRTFLNMEEQLPTPTEEQIRTILKKIDKLPPNHNLDCRACGYPTCRDKAIAVAQGIAEADMCMPYLLEQSKRIYQQLEKSHRELQLSHQELEQAQTQLIRTEKLASLGQLAAGVAHEINNPLGTITIYAHLLLKSMDKDDPRREDVELIVSEGNRAKEIVQGLLSFARERKLRPGPVNLNDLLDDVLGLVVNQSLFQNIKIKKSLLQDLPTIVADETQLKQVFLNIILNAAQAMEGNGRLSITTGTERKQIRVKIRDTGPGIPPEVRKNIFSPFFTTKEKGTGLGLAISYGIIERHNGKIDVETELGKGSTFIISLPTSTGEEQRTEDVGTSNMGVQNTTSGRRDYGEQNQDSTGR